MYKLREGKNQKIFDKRLKNNPLKRINHGLNSVDIHCRICNFSDFGMNEMAQKAKRHAEKTGHTIDIYRENRIELTYYKK